MPSWRSAFARLSREAGVERGGAGGLGPRLSGASSNARRDDRRHAQLRARAAGPRPADLQPAPADLWRADTVALVRRAVNRWDAVPWDRSLRSARDPLALPCGRSFETLSGGRTRAPGTTARPLAGFDEHYHGCEDWEELKQLPTDPLFEFIKDERNGLTHRRRSPAEPPIVYGFTGPGEEETVGVIDAQSHYAFLPAFYNHVFRRALGWTRSVIAAAAEGDQA
jgi:hypothetical protein